MTHNRPGYDLVFREPAITVLSDQRDELIERLSAENHRLSVANAKLERSNSKLAAERNELAMRLRHAEDRADSLHKNSMELRTELFETGDAVALKRERDEARTHLNAEQKSGKAIVGALFDAMGGHVGGVVEAAVARIKRCAVLERENADLRVELGERCCQRAAEERQLPGAPCTDEFALLSAKGGG